MRGLRAGSQHPGQLDEIADHRQREQVLLAGEVAVDDRAVDADSPGDVVDVSLADTVVVEEPPRRRDDLGLARPAASGSRTPPAILVTTALLSTVRVTSVRVTSVGGGGVGHAAHGKCQFVNVGVVFRPQQPPEELQAVVRAVDEAGVPELWLWEDCFLEGGLTTATAALAWSRLRVGVGLLPVPLRNPALVAMEIATITRLFPDRFVPALGHGVLDWMAQVGARAESPMALLREHTTAVRDLLDGRRVEVEGRYVRLDGVALDWPPATRPQLLVGARGDKTVRLAGEVADGVLLDGVGDADAVRRGRRLVDEGREASGRPGRAVVTLYRRSTRATAGLAGGTGRRPGGGVPGSRCRHGRAPGHGRGARPAAAGGGAGGRWTADLGGRPHAIEISSPSTVIGTSVRGLVAGGLTAVPSSTEKALPWHSQRMPPACTELTMQPWWVQTAVKHLNSPSTGWVTTTCLSGKITPPPTGTSAALVSGPGSGDVAVWPVSSEPSSGVRLRHHRRQPARQG